MVDISNIINTSLYYIVRLTIAISASLNILFYKYLQHVLRIITYPITMIK